MSAKAKASMSIRTKKKKISYAKWGYLFLIPFFIVFIVFQLIPLIQTFYYSFFEDYYDGLDHIGPNFIGWANYASVFSDNFGKYLGNTLLIWVIGFVPQIIVSLLLAIWFTDMRLKLKCTGLFKTIVYMPNLVMASALGMLFLTLTSQIGPITKLFVSWGWVKENTPLVNLVWGCRGVIAFMNFLMWFGNTTILLMSGVMGIDSSIYEAARIDGASAWRVFWDITMPLLMPIFTYVFITSMIGGIQLFDCAQIFTSGSGGPDLTSMTLMMILYKTISSSNNVGEGGALSVVLFIITAILSFGVFMVTGPRKDVQKQSGGNGTGSWRKKASVKSSSLSQNDVEQKASVK